MLEKEIKILEVNTVNIIHNLLSLGAQKTFEGNITDIYFDFHHQVENKKKEAEKIFRLRKKGDKNVYTVKHKKYQDIQSENVMVKEEVETHVGNFNDFSKMLEMQWMTAIRRKEKYRVSYVLWNTVFDFDTYNGIPTLLEIEDSSWDNIYAWIKRLWLYEKELLIWGSRMLFDKYKMPYTYC